MISEARPLAMAWLGLPRLALCPDQTSNNSYWPSPLPPLGGGSTMDSRKPSNSDESLKLRGGTVGERGLPAAQMALPQPGARLD